jgi:hypothetical protein
VEVSYRLEEGGFIAGDEVFNPMYSAIRSGQSALRSAKSGDSRADGVVEAGQGNRSDKHLKADRSSMPPTSCRAAHQRLGMFTLRRDSPLSLMI